jgi:hypothetical protein
MDLEDRELHTSVWNGSCPNRKNTISQFLLHGGDFSVVAAPLTRCEPQPLRQCATCNVKGGATSFSKGQCSKGAAARCRSCVSAAEAALSKVRRKAFQKPTFGKPAARSGSALTDAIEGGWDNFGPKTKLGHFCREFIEKNRNCIAKCTVPIVGARPAPLSSQIAKTVLKVPTASLELVFHGTAFENIVPICTGGFAMPGRRGVRVVNGSSYGVGIYSSTDAATSSYYTRGHNEIMLCALTKSSVVERPTDTIRVAKHEGLLLPLFLVRFDLSSKSRDYLRHFDAVIKRSAAKTRATQEAVLHQGSL